jgi:hypothetical protein
MQGQEAQRLVCGPSSSRRTKNISFSFAQLSSRYFYAHFLLLSLQ